MNEHQKDIFERLKGKYGHQKGIFVRQKGINLERNA